MIICDQGGCPARATRQVWFDSGRSLWFCSHHSAQWFPTPHDARFDLEPSEIIT